MSKFPCKSLTREEELALFDHLLKARRRWVKVLEDKIKNWVENILRNKKALRELEKRISSDISRILYISSYRHRVEWLDVDYIKFLEKEYLEQEDYENLTKVRYITVYEEYIEIKVPGLEKVVKIGRRDKIKEKGILALSDTPLGLKSVFAVIPWNNPDEVADNIRKIFNI